jgi:hypothetical protein
MTEKSYSSIVARLTKTRDGIANRAACEGALNVLSFIALALVFLWLTTLIFWPGPIFKSIAAFVLIAGMVALSFVAIALPLLRKKPLAQVAIRLEKYYGKLQSRLIAALQLYDKIKANKENYSIDLIEKTIDEAGAEIKDLDFAVIIEKDKKPYWRVIITALMLILVFAISGQALIDAIGLYARPFANITKPSHLVLTVTPATTQAIKNEDVGLAIAARGEKIRRLDFNFKFEDGNWVKAPFEELVKDTLVGDSLYHYTFKKIKRAVEFYAEAKSVRSPVGKIAVIDPPRLISAAVRLEFPAYTGLPSQDLPPNDGSVTALRGTAANFTGFISKPVKAASMVFADSTRKNMSIDNRKVTGQFVVHDNLSYHIEATDSTNLRNPGPIEYSIVPLDDYSPRVVITFPAVDIDLDENMKVPIKAELYDDYGISKLELVYWTLSEGKESSKNRIVLKTTFPRVTETNFEYVWNVEELTLMPGDLVYYYLEVYDNDNITGPKSGVSKTYSARLPSLDEIMADITGSQKDVMQEAEAASTNQKQLKEELEKISREMMKTPEMDWQKKQQVQQAVERQKEIAQKIQDVAQKLQDNIEKFEKNQLATQDMLDKMQEIQQLMEKVATPELKEIMRKLEEALQKMDPDKIKEAMKNFQLDIEKMNKNLDRALALLKKFELEQKLDTMAKMAQKLAEQQQNINDRVDSAQNKQDLQNLERPQENQKQGLDNLKDQFQESKELNQEMKMFSPEDMQKAEQQLNSPELQEMLQSMSQNMKSGNQGNCKQSGKKLQQDFQEMANTFESLLKKMQSQQQQMITQNLRKIIEDILYLSQQQEALVDSTKDALNITGAPKEMANRQKDLETATGRVANRVSDITKETMFVGMGTMEKLGQAMQSMESASSNLDKRLFGQAPNEQLKAMSALNQSAMMLMKSMEQAKACPSGTGMQQFMQQLSELGQKQQNLNQQGQSMMPFPLGRAMSMMQQQQLEQMAAQQEAIRQSLQEMTEQYGSGGDNILGRLDSLGKEMQRVADDLKRHNLNESTIRQQERILTRLLDAQKSVNRRDYTQKRQARTAEDMLRRSPGSIDAQIAGDEKLAEDIKKALAEKYPRRYENLIKEYFKALAEEKTLEK